MGIYMKKIAAISSSAVTYLLLAVPAFAQINVDPCEVAATSSNVRNNLCNISGNNAGTLIANAITGVLVIAAVIALFFLVWGGIKWILSGGDKAKVEAARGTIIAAIVGLVITFLAYFILNLVLSLFGLSLSNLVLPNLTVTQ
jgi:hypothetical protein